MNTELRSINPGIAALNGKYGTSKPCQSIHFNAQSYKICSNSLDKNKKTVKKNCKL